MISSLLTVKNFRKGVHLYLNKYKYGNADHTQFLECLDEIGQKTGILPDIASRVTQFKTVTLKELMKYWLYQEGYPLVELKRDYETSSAFISQV